MTWINQHLTIEHFTPERESWIRYELQGLLTEECSQAFPKGIDNPTNTIINRGVIIRPAEDLYRRSAAQLGLSEEDRLGSVRQFFGHAYSTPQGGTVFGSNGSAQIYLHDSAFRGESWRPGIFSLAEVLEHEFIHGGGQGPWPGRLGNLRHDLAGLPAYKNIIEACRRN
jgi:hypothetical protein